MSLQYNYCFVHSFGFSLIKVFTDRMRHTHKLSYDTLMQTRLVPFSTKRGVHTHTPVPGVRTHVPVPVRKSTSVPEVFLQHGYGVCTLIPGPRNLSQYNFGIPGPRNFNGTKYRTSHTKKSNSGKYPQYPSHAGPRFESACLRF